MKRNMKVLIADKLHRGFVYSCMGLTVLGTVQLFASVFQFYTVVKPKHEEASRRELMELLKEGREIVEEMKDKAPTTTA